MSRNKKRGSHVRRLQFCTWEKCWGPPWNASSLQPWLLDTLTKCLFKLTPCIDNEKNLHSELNVHIYTLRYTSTHKSWEMRKRHWRTDIVAVVNYQRYITGCELWITTMHIFILFSSTWHQKIVKFYLNNFEEEKNLWKFYALSCLRTSVFYCKIIKKKNIPLALPGIVRGCRCANASINLLKGWMCSIRKVHLVLLKGNNIPSFNQINELIKQK